MKMLFIILLWLSAITLNANNFYVAKTGNDVTGNGSLGNPWLTITKGESMLVAGRGDILFVRGGNYVENVIINGCAGTANAPTVITNYPNETPVIYGHITDMSLGGYGVMIYRTDYIHFNGFEVVNTSTPIHISGAYCKVSNCIVHDTWYNGIVLTGHNGIIEYCTVYNGSMNNENLAHPSGWGSGIAAHRDHIDNITEYAIIRHCIVHDFWGEGIVLGNGRYGIIEDNVVYDVLTPCYYMLNHENGLLQRNIAYRTKNMGPGADGYQVGIGHWDEEIDELRNEYNVIINNIVYGFNRNIFAADLDHSLIANNTFVNSAYYSCVFLNGTHNDSEIRNNIIIQEDALSCIYLAVGGGITFSNNLYNKSYAANCVGANDVTDDPDFVETGGVYTSTYYGLAVGSPAINAGIDINVDYDYNGNVRDATPDIGALEYGGSSPPSSAGKYIFSNGKMVFSNNKAVIQ